MNGNAPLHELHDNYLKPCCSEPAKKRLLWQLCKHSEETKTTFKNLPLEILFEIFSRLPIPSIIRARCTCKSWNKIMTDPKFLVFHFEKVLKNPGYLIYLTRGIGRTDTFLYHVGSIGGGDEPEAMELHNRPKGEEGFQSYYPHGMYSSGGLSAHAVWDAKCQPQDCFFYVTNPITGEYIKVPLDLNMHGMSSFRFGYSPLTKEYKLIKLGGATDGVFYGAVFTLGQSESWREIPDVPFFPGTQVSVDCDGVVFWDIFERKITHEGPHGTVETFMSFDIASESFRGWRGPPVNRSVPRCDDNGHLMQIDHSIAWVQLVGSGSIEVWILRDKIEETWIRKYHIAPSVPSIVELTDFDVRGSWINGDLLGRKRFGQNYTWSANSGEINLCPMFLAKVFIVDVLPQDLMQEHSCPYLI